MINLQVEFDKSLKLDDIKTLEKHIAGIYILYGIDENPLYIGESSCVKTRILAHVAGLTNTMGYCDEFSSVKIILEDDWFLRRLVESYLIANTKGLKNAHNPFNDKYAKKKNDFSKVKIFGVCGHEMCKAAAHSNGYCHRHGGNGMSKSFVMNKALEDFMLGTYKPKME